MVEAQDVPRGSRGWRGSRGVAPTGRLSTGVLVTAGWLSALNGVAHFALPAIYPWAEHVEGLYEPVRWALYATTVFFGVLMLLAGLLVVVVARTPDVPARVTTWVVGGMAVFWLVGAVYEVLVPFPDPAARWALPVFSLVVAVLLVAGLWLRVRAVTARRAAARDR